jgi:hypothetical protein
MSFKGFNIFEHIGLPKLSGVDVLGLDLSLNNKNYARKVWAYSPFFMDMDFLYVYIKGT